MTANELRRRFPNASPDFIKDNADDTGVCAVQPQPAKRVSLESIEAGEEACWHDVDAVFEIVFTIYSVRPCDWDGYDIKSLQDFLVSAGILPGDGWKTLSGRVYSRKAATKDEEKTVIEITALHGSI